MKTLSILVLAGILTACAAASSKPRAAPHDPNHVDVDLTGATCRPLAMGPPGFVTFLCATSDAADDPHKAARETHSEELTVSVPRAQAEAFLLAHMGPEPSQDAGQPQAAPMSNHAGDGVNL